MAITRTRKCIGDAQNGINLTTLTDPKLKTSGFMIKLISPLTEENAAANAAAAFMLEDSCSEYPSITAFSRRLAELYGASIQTGVSRFADSSVITLSASCIADRYALEGEEISTELARLMIMCLFAPVTENGSFPEKSFALKKQELVDDIDADINDKRLYALKKAGMIIYRSEPSGISVKGEREAAMAMTAPKAYEAYKQLLEGARIEIYYVGSGMTDNCCRTIENAFAGLRRKNVYTPKITPSAPKTAPEYKSEYLDVAQSKMVMAYKTNIDNEAIARVFNALLGATPFSLLFKNVRERLSLCYYCSSSINFKKQTLFIDSGVEKDNIEAARKEIENQMNAAAKGDFSDELLEQTKLFITCSLKAINDSPRAVSGWYFSQCLNDEESIKTPEMLIDEIERVTKEQTAEYAASFTPDTVYILTQHPTDTNNLG